MLLPHYWQLPEPHSCCQGRMARHHHACLSLSILCPPRAPNSQLEVDGARESFPILSPLGVTGFPSLPPRGSGAASLLLCQNPVGLLQGVKSDRA